MRFPAAVLALSAFAFVLAGCSAGPEPESIPSPPTPSQAPPPVVSGGADSVGAIPGSSSSMYVYRFRQVAPPGQFNYRDRDLSFYFRPTPTALYFRVENLQGRPVNIVWDECRFVDVDDRVSKPAHSTTRWGDRFSPLVQTQIPGQQQYGDYVFPMDYLMDPGSSTGTDDQPHKPLVPEDSSAPTFSGRSFGVDLVFMIEDRPRTYSIRFQVQGVIPR